MVHFNFNLVSWKYIGFKAYALSFALQLLSLTSQVCTLPCHFDFLREEWTSSFCCCSLAACSGLTGSVAMLGPRSGLLVSLQTGRRQGNPQTQIQGWREESWEESRLEWKTPPGRWVIQHRVGWGTSPMWASSDDILRGVIEELPGEHLPLLRRVDHRLPLGPHCCPLPRRPLHNPVWGDGRLGQLCRKIFLRECGKAITTWCDQISWF